MSRILLCCAALLLASVSDSAARQAERIPVLVRVSSQTGEPVAGAIVRALGTDGTTSAQALTGETGLATLNIPAAGDYRFEVERLGYAAWTSPVHPIGLGGRELIELTVPAQAIGLEPILVEQEGRCSLGPPALVSQVVTRLGRLLGMRPAEPSTSGQTGPLLARAYRAAMEGLNRVIDGRPPGAVYWVRTISEAPRTLVDTTVVIRTDTAIERRATPLEAAPPDFLARNGFIEPRLSVHDLPIYHAPAPEVIVSESFIGTHCFRGVEHSDSTWLGLLFEPAPGVGHADVKGTVWVDTRTGNVTRIEFQYTGLAEFLEQHEWRYATAEVGQRIRWLRDQAIAQNRDLQGPQRGVSERVPISVPAREYGGTVEFGDPGNGAWDVVRWEIRWPVLRGGASYSHTFRRGTSDYGVWVHLILHYRIPVPYYTAAEVVEVQVGR